MKIRYDALSPADDGELIDSGELEVPDDAGPQAILGALENTIERKAAVVSGAQVRVVTDSHISHTWDHA